MTGIQFITDEKGRKTAAIIDLKKHRSGWKTPMSDLLDPVPSGFPPHAFAGAGFARK